MKTTVKKIFALCLCAALILGMTGATFALRSDAPQQRVRETAEPAAAADPSPAREDARTLFVLTDSCGAVEKLMEGETQVEGETPLDLQVTYWLDGRQTEPAELAGQSGHLRIRIDYTVKQTVSAELDGETRELTVPYLAVTGLLLDRAVAENVTVSDGRVHMDESRIVVVGWALPGLAADLGEDLGDVTLPDSLEIEADVHDFSMDMILTLVTREIFTELDPDCLELDDVTEKMDALDDAMTQLLAGAGDLAAGMDQLNGGVDALSSGTEQLADGARQVADGAAAMETGAARLSSGAQQLSQGLETLDANSAALNSGALQVFQSLLAAANEQLAAAGLEVPTLTVTNYDTVLDGVIASLDPEAVYAKAEAAVTAAVEANRPAITAAVTEAVRAQVTAQVTEAVRAQVTAQVTEAVRAQIRPQVESAVRAEVRAQVILAVTGLSPEEYEQAVSAGAVDAAVQTQIEAAVDQKMATEEIRALIEQNVETQLADSAVQAQTETAVAQQMASEAVQTVIEQNVEVQMASEAVQAVIEQNVEAQIAQLIAENMQSEAVQAQLAAASEGAQSVMELKISLDSYYAFYQGLLAYTAGVSQAAAGAAALSQGAASLQAGAVQLTAGAEALSQGAARLNGQIPALAEGVDRLQEGAEALRDGLEQFNDEAVSPITQEVLGRLLPLAKRIHAILEAADEGEPGRYVYRTAGIGA